jgi:hypothetical protein
MRTVRLEPADGDSGPITVVIVPTCLIDNDNVNVNTTPSTKLSNYDGGIAAETSRCRQSATDGSDAVATETGDTDNNNEDRPMDDERCRSTITEGRRPAAYSDMEENGSCDHNLRTPLSSDDDIRDRA